MISRKKEQMLENGFSNFCGCNSFTGEKCTDHKTAQFDDYEDYTGKFPMAKGTRGDHVEALQRFLVSKMVLVMGKTPYGYFGDATEKGLKQLNLPVLISSEAELLSILGLEPATPAVSQKPDPNLFLTNPQMYANNWKQAAKDPNQFLSIADRIKGLVGKKPQLDANTKVNVDNLPANAAGTATDTNAAATTTPAKAPIPTVVWIVGGLVVLILVVFLVMKTLKDE